MAIPLVQVRHKTTGAKTFLPETALANFPDYVKTPSQKARDEVPDGSAFPTELGQADELQEPPRSGAGSGIDAWRSYAAQRGVEVPEGASRDDIVALVDAANIQQ